MANSLRDVRLKDDSFYSTSRWPRCLSQLRKLNSLSISLRNGFLSSSPTTLLQELESLSPSLEILELNSRDFRSASSNAPQLDFPANADEHSLATNKVASETRPFQSLRVVRFPVGDRQPIRILRPLLASLLLNIRELEAEEGAYYLATEDTYSFLPQNLEFLKSTLFILESFKDTFLSHFPSTLTRISCIHWYGDVSLMRALPKRLRIDHFDLSSILWDYEFSSLCPQNIGKISIGEIDDQTFEYHNVTWDSQLPSQIEGLDCSSTCNPRRLADFPMLKHYAGGSLPGGGKELTNLQSAVFYSLPITQLEHLPRSLTALELRHGLTDDRDALAKETGAPLHFPPLLRSLHLEDLYKPLEFDLSTLPHLTILQCSAPMPISSISQLPLTLTNLQGSWPDCDYEKTSLLRLVNMKTMRIETWDAKALHQLPRSLTDLQITDLVGLPLVYAEKNVDYFKELPTGLLHLTLKHKQQRIPIVYSASSFSGLRELRTLKFCHYSCFEFGIIKQLSRALQNLTIKFDAIRPEFISFFPPRLNRLSFSVGADNTIIQHVLENEESLKLWPMCASSDRRITNKLANLKEEAEKRALLYPDPRILESKE